ncbi:alpha/beta hydrolase [Pseudooceanicola sp. CBS1P-1]|uniref:Alpha/beta fold hydrolase n=1 Tax=Pseudooceanicola albus TaxID=2692189 RepID=A0A6L7FZI8_9RHOB|nr:MULTISPECIES: alpha/beta fold hydrolase [Pseudooceanicola]MBT9385696.1 alpha/beta hydrolase [Pseudooceanicola endophyticus]MXN16730.1 alpha/beta fold hydrolase [Pseudooceanicola albus]
MTPILLIPGLMATPALFAAQIPALWPHGPVSVANTLRGETIAEMATAILADAPPRFALAGLSMGGYIAMEIMRQAPERVERLALLDTTARPDTDQQTAYRRATLETLAPLEGRQLRLAYAASLPGLVHAGHVDGLRNEVVTMSVSLGHSVLAQQSAAIISRPDSRPDLPGYDLPVLVLVGAEDVLTPPEMAREMAEAIPGAQLVVVPQCGHLATMEQPEAVNLALLDWLRR